MRNTLFAILLLGTLLLAACAPAPANADAVATAVAATLQASAPTAAPALTGFASGKICFPSSSIPSMNLYFQQSGSDSYTSVHILEHQSTYSAELTPGTYTAYAWLPLFNIAGSYSQMVPCGLGASCKDHTLISFNVAAGQTTSGIDVCDWYGNPGDVPLPPGLDVNASMGSISGSLNYPSEGIPSLNVVAFDINSSLWFYVTTQQGSDSYQIDGLPPGSYYVVAYPNLEGINAEGGYSAAVPCGLTADCSDHSLLPVDVTSSHVTENIDPTDWYAPPGSFPASPIP